MASKPKFKHGDKVRCIQSESVGYTVGSLYLVTRCPRLDVLAIKSDDGYYDPLSLLLSQFTKEERDQCKQDYLKVVSDTT